MNKDPLVALEIGTSRTVVAVGDPVAPGRIRVSALGVIPSSGVRRSRIVDIARAGISVASAVKRAEANGEFRIGQANLAVSGSQVTVRTCRTALDLPGPTVSENDMNELVQLAVEGEKPETPRTLLDRSEISWELDGVGGITSPKGMNGKSLALKTLVVEGAGGRIADATAACEQAGIGVSDVFFSASCAAQAVLTPTDRAAGTLVIDLGAGSTNWLAVCEGRTVHAGTLGVGGDHVTNDVHEAFAVSRGQAADLVREASAVLLPERAVGRIAVSKSLTAVRTDSVSRRALDTVVNARLAETLSLVRADLERAGVLANLNGGIVLTGGGACQNGIVPLAGTIFGRDARVGQIVPEIEGLEKEADPARLAVVAGLLLVAQGNAPEADGLIESFIGTFGKVFHK